jgi:hypothetical protein
MRRRTWYLIGFFVTCALSAAHELAMHWHDIEPGGGATYLTGLVAVFFLVLWVDADSRTQAQIYRPFEFGYLVLLLWIPYLPYYLWRTRRWRGAVMLGLFAVSFFAGYLGRWILYALS